MNNYVYSGPFKNEITNFLKYKIDKRQTIHPIACYLYQFDQFTLELKENKLTREIVENWLVLKKGENRNTLRMRAWSIKSFAKYLNLIGIEAYIIDSKQYQCKSTYIPHIFTTKEITVFFHQLDIVVKNSKYFPNNKKQLKLFFKILYCCGLRDSEAIKLKYKDIDLENKCLLVHESKNGISRLIYFDDDIYNDLRNYIEEKPNKMLDDFIFKNYKTNNRRDIYSIYPIFHSIIKNDGFDKNIHYRIHDFRHTFAVRNIKRVYEGGEDVYAFLPILMTYMGHSSIRSTEYYLRFTPDVYQKVTEQFEVCFNNVIPKIDGEFYEQ